MKPLNIMREVSNAAVINNTIVVCGGYVSKSDEYLNSCEHYSIETNDWYFGSNLSENKTDLALVVHNGLVLYAIGGYHPTTGAMNTVERYDLVSRQWKPMASMHTKRYSMGCTVFMDKIYVCGGGGGGGHNTCETYDPIANQWTPIGSMIEKRIEFRLVVHGDNQLLYALGGFPYLNSIELYDYRSNQWHTSSQTLPYELFAFGATTLYY
ncbi:kelch-like protein 20 [Oppia nitens]|uniref:kelch-like protein 20 n=1 Tax=Oppia nitens TaxID=1686743 RepID=UPI0023D97B19|nr:kelch-like protein 20 [Oppia nitens]